MAPETTLIPKKPRVVKTIFQFQEKTIPVYMGTRVSKALQEVTMDMDLYKGVRLAELLEAVYDQGRKDGARYVRDSFDQMMQIIPHKNPGKPKRR